MPSTIAKQRARIWARGDRECFYCGAPFASWADMTLDHVVPVSAGGSSRLGNLVPACQPCNRAKGSMDAVEFAAFVNSCPDWREMAREHLARQHRLENGL